MGQAALPSGEMGHEEASPGARPVPFVSASHEILFEDDSAPGACAMCDGPMSSDASHPPIDDDAGDVCELCASVVGVIALSQHDLEEEEG